MGRKSSSKGQVPPPVPTTKKKGPGAALIGVILAAVVGVGVLAFWRGSDADGSAAAAPAGTAAAATTATAQTPSPDIEARSQATAAFGPHKQANLPPVPFKGYAPPRPPEVVTAAFQFAAEHPEVLSYIPCFCGCQQGGHKGNHDCFVRSRAANGDVIDWEEHGVECAVCIDVATRSRQMHASGASVRDIRAAVEKEFAPNFPSMTPTPKPPAAHSH